MLRARFARLLIFGLSDKNLELLKQDKPIVFALSALGVEGGYSVMIFHGETEEVMAERLNQLLSGDPGS